jgi:hypothetical protein
MLMKKKKSPKSDVAPELQAATSPYSKTSARCSPVPTNMPKSVNTTATPGADPGPPVSSVGPKERAIIEEIVEALQEINIDELPESPRGESIQGLQSALESLISPQVEPRDHHSVRFNIRLTERELRVGQAAIDAAWEISSFDRRQGADHGHEIAVALGLDLEHAKTVVFVEKGNALYQPGEAFRTRRWRLVRHGGDILRVAGGTSKKAPPCSSVRTALSSDSGAEG